MIVHQHEKCSGKSINILKLEIKNTFSDSLQLSLLQQEQLYWQMIFVQDSVIEVKKRTCVQGGLHKIRNLLGNDIVLLNL